MFSVVELEEKEMDSFLSLLQERAKWLDDRKMGMWKLSELSKEAIAARYDSPVPFLALDDEERVGGFLLMDKDNRYWGRKEKVSAFYVHKLFVRAGFGGWGYSDSMIEWIKQYGKQNGKAYIRLDYQRKREYLRKLYFSHGFVDVEELQLEDGVILTKAECRIG